MAGLNTRFHDAGFDIPKYLLPWGESTIIAEIIKELTKNYSFEQIILLPNIRDSYFKPQLLDTIKPLGLTEENIH
jgi:NDP-sugar pyrophosphorylase family protein